MKHNQVILFSFFSMVFSSCLKKDDLRWTLPRGNDLDMKQNTKTRQCAYFDCESTDGFNFMTKRGSWRIDNGLVGKAFVSNDILERGSISFSGYSSSNFVLSFWAISGYYAPNNSGAVFEYQLPVVSLGSGITEMKTAVMETKKNKQWIRFQTSTIPAGFYQIQIKLANSDYPRIMEYAIDEIELLCE